MKQGILIELTSEIAILDAKSSIDHKIPMADSIILATAQTYEAVIWTEDADFKGIQGVKYFPKKMRNITHHSNKYIFSYPFIAIELNT